MLTQIIVQQHQKKKVQKIIGDTEGLKLRLSLDLCTELVTFYPETARA